MNTIDLINYYANLLIIQYIGKPKAYATIQTQVNPVVMPQTSVQTITFPLIPTSGTFVLSYNGSSTPPINWNDSAAVIQAYLRNLAPFAIDGGDAGTTVFDEDINGGDASTSAFDEDIDGGSAFGFGVLNGIVVTGSIASGILTVTLFDITPPADLLVLESTTLMSSGDLVTPVITEIDETLPVAVQNAFNIIGPNMAVGAQLDVIGKYAGVIRTAAGFTTQITLNDSDFSALIQMAIIKNNSGSSLATIQQLLHQFFPDEVLVFDYQDMSMSYLIDSTIGSQDLVQLFVTEGLLPKPMAVRLNVVIYAPDITKFFGFRTYVLPAYNATPFNTYVGYHMDWTWLSYANAVIVTPP